MTVTYSQAFGAVVAAAGVITVWAGIVARGRRFSQAREIASQVADKTVNLYNALAGASDPDEKDQAKKAADEISDRFDKLLEKMPADDRFPTFVVGVGAAAVVFGAAIAGLITVGAAVT